MMKLRSDDDVYRARLDWLGPQNYTLPVQLPYTQWLCGAAITAVFTGLIWLFTGPSWFGMSIAIGAAMPTTALIFRFVDPDRPARMIITTVVKDWRYTGPRPAGPEPRLSARKVRVTP